MLFKVTTRIKDVDSGTSESYTTRLHADSPEEARRLAKRDAEQVTDGLPYAKVSVSVKEC